MITAPDPEWLKSFTRQLIEHRLAASAHNFALIQSIYRWRGDIYERPEGRVSLHTSRARVPEIIARVPGASLRSAGNIYQAARCGRPTPLGQAFAEYGRIDKTMHLLSILDPIADGYRRTLGKQLPVQESRHRLARKICHGGNGQIRQTYREGQEDQPAALGLVVNAVTLGNSTYLPAITDQLRAQGIPVKDEDVAGLSPLGHAHLNYLGRYAIASSAPSQGLRPPGRHPSHPDRDSDD